MSFQGINTVDQLLHHVFVRVSYHEKKASSTESAPSTGHMKTSCPRLRLDSRTEPRSMIHVLTRVVTCYSKASTICQGEGGAQTSAMEVYQV